MHTERRMRNGMRDTFRKVPGVFVSETVAGVNLQRTSGKLLTFETTPTYVLPFPSRLVVCQETETFSSIILRTVETPGHQ